MKLLFDANVSHKLVRELASEYPDSTHVRDIGLRGAEDGHIWHHARTHGFVIVSKDADFRERSYVEGFPPKVIWLDVANAGTAVIATLLRGERERIERFEALEETSLLLARERLATLLPAVALLREQISLAIEVRSAASFHDRYVFVDRSECYQSGASFKDGAKKAPTTLTQIVDAFSAVCDTYEQKWASAVQQ